MTYHEETWDGDYDVDDYWDDDAYPAQEEPHCFHCCDSGVAPPRGLRRLLRRDNCPSCAPTRLDDWLWVIRWRAGALVRKVRPRRRILSPGAFDDEAPF